VEVVCFPEADTPAELRGQVLALQAEAWPGDGSTGHDPQLHPVSMLLVDEGDVVAALDILSKELDHAGERYLAAGLSTVVTRRDARRHGHGRHLVETARDAIARDGFDLGLFTCDRELRGFYESAGWELLPDTVVVGGTPSAPFPSDQAGFDKVTMAAFFSTAAHEHRATFDRARIELYPGDIDKLW
jgi:aminoglycoside 2'-N-acetyltransferase I